MELKITKIGNSMGIILPKEMIASLNLDKGDSVWVCEEADNKISLTPYDPEFAEQMEVARSIMKKRRNVLRELAK